MANFHEDLRRGEEHTGSSDRTLGLVFAAFFLILALAPVRTHRPVRLPALAVSIAFLAIALLRPGILHSLNRLWTALGLLLGRIVNPVVTAVLFYVVFTPMGLLLRLFGKVPIETAMSPELSTYWIRREPADQRAENMARLF